MNPHTLIAMLPIIFLIVALMFFSKYISTLRSCILSFIITCVLAKCFWEMPFKDIVVASAEGTIMSLWPISAVIIAAVFLYNICDSSGNIEHIRSSISSLSTDRRVLVLLVAWGFGGFIEGIAGFGTSIPIVASMLLALGFSPLVSAALALVSNPVSSVFGSLGVQMPILSQVTGIPSNTLAVLSTYVVIPIVLITPIVLVYITEKSYQTRPSFSGIWPIIIISGITFAFPMYLVVKYVNEDLTGVAGAVCSLSAMTLATIFFRAKTTPPFERAKWKKQCISWAPFMLCIIFLLITSKIFPQVYKFLSHAKLTIHFTFSSRSSEYVVNFLTVSAPWIFLSAFLGGKIQGLKTRQCSKILCNTVVHMWKTIITLMLLLAISRIMTYSGMIDEIALALVHLTGTVYVIMVPLLATIGAFITGSATSANVLLGNLQIAAAKELGKDPSLFMAFSIVGGTIGKMISPQSIAIGLNAVEATGDEGKILWNLLRWYFLFLLILMVSSVIANCV